MQILPCYTASRSDKLAKLRWLPPCHNDRKLFEMLILEGGQAGLGWIIVLRRHDNYRVAFDQFDEEKVAFYEEVKVNELLINPGIIRSRLKVNAAIANARTPLAIKDEFGSFASYIIVAI